MSRRPHSTRVWIVLALLLSGMGFAFEASAAPGDPLAFFTVVPPCRVFDSREPGPQFAGDGPALEGNETEPIQITGVNGDCNIPLDAEEAVVNVTVTQPTTGGKLFVGSGDALLPSEATEKMTFTPGATEAVYVPSVSLNALGRINVHLATGGEAHVFVDVYGYYAPGSNPPVLTAGGTLNYTEGDPATAIDTGITVTDPDSANLQSATAQITGNYQNGADVLSFVDTATITGAFNAATGMLTLTGADTVANWQTALRSVLYNNTSEDPSTAARTVTWIASDGVASSAPVTSTVNVAAENDAPVLTAGGILNYTEGDPATAIDATITVADPDNANLQSATAQITGNYQNGQDVLSFVDTATITAVFNAATGTLTLTGTDTLANWQAALRSVRYENTSEDPSNLARTVTWIASDGTDSSAPVTSTINIGGSPDAPVLTAGGTLSYTEGDPATAIDTTITVNDPDSTDLQSATVQITGNYQNGADVLSFTNTATITGVFTVATGTLTLTGADTLANWQTALRNVRYNNTSEEPSTAPRTVTWIASDGANSSTPVTSTINVAAELDAPVLTAGGTLSYTEGDPATAIDTTITVSDPDSANLQSATAQITANYQNGQDVLSFVNTATITGVFNAATGTLTLTGSDTLANWQTALRSVLYNNTSEDPSTTARTVTWIADDGGATSAPVTSTINVAAVADAPVLTAGGVLNYAENDPPTAIDMTITVSDADSANLQSATAQITGNYQNGADVLSFTNTATITGLFNAATGTLTLTGTDTLANWQAALRSVRYSNASDNPSILPRTVTWIASDGGASSSPVTSTINVSQTNDAPVLTAGGVLNYTENDPATAIDTTITVIDPDSANLQSATAQITGNYQNGEDVLSFVNTATITGVFNAATGTLTLTGADTPANWQTALRSVLYSNTSSNPTTSPRTVTWIASDGSVSSSPVTSTINVASAPDAPVVTAGGVLNYTENGPPTAIDTTITVTDEDSTNLQSATVQITGNYQNGQDVLSFVNTATITGVFSAATGTLTLTGTDTVANWQTALRSVRYNNTSENPSALARTVTWIASDGGASSTPVTSTINVTSVPDAPVVTAGGTLNYTENDPATAIDSGLTVSDVDSANLQSATVQITGNYQNGQDILSFSNTATITGVFSAATGTLTLTGTDTVANWQTALRNVRYSNPSDNPSALARTVTWIVSDGGVSSTPVTSTINVIPVNDAPTTGADTAWDTIGNTRLIVAAADPEDDGGQGPYIFVAGNVLANDTDPDGPAVALTATLANANGATVNLNSDGTFTYVPPAGAPGPHSFTYNAFDGVANTPGTVTIDLVNRVWYVKNNTSTPGTAGTSADPFKMLSQAQSSSVTGDYIFVYQGDGMTTGQNAGIILKAGQHLIGEAEGLTIDTSAPVNGNASTSLVDVGGRPLIGNAVADGSGVAATDVVPAEIAGLSLAGSGNAIDLTITAAVSGTLTIRNNEFRGAGAGPGGAGFDEGIDINAGGSGTLTLNVQENFWTAAAASHVGNAVDIVRTAGTLRLDFSTNINLISANAAGSAVNIVGGAAASTTITGFSGNTVSGNSLGAGVLVSNTTFDANATAAGIQQVLGGNLMVGASGNPVTSAGMILSTVLGNLYFENLNIYAGTSGLTINGAMTFAVKPDSPDGGTSAIDADNGAAVDITSATIDLRLADLDSTTSGSGVALSSVAGQLRAPSGSSITKASGGGTAFSVASSSATVNYSGTLNVTSGSGAGLSGNTGAVNFSGMLTLNTGNSPAFAATGGGTVTATATNSTITTSTATALSVNGPDIGPGGLVFQSITVNGAGTGILLQDTGTTAGLTVSGIGTTGGSGGTIQNISGRGASFINAAQVNLKNMNFTNNATSAGAPCGSAATVGANTGCNAAIHLNNVTGVTFDRLNITTSGQQGINGIDVTGLTLSNSTLSGLGNAADEDGLHFHNLLGTNTISSTSITSSGDDNANIQNRAATPSTINITGGAFNTGVLGSGLLFGIRDTSNTTINITGVTSDNNFSGGIVADSFDSSTMKLDVTGSTISNNNDGIQVSASQTANAQFDIDNNDFIGNDFLAITLLKAAFSTAGTLEGAVRNNNPITVGNGRPTDAISVFQAGGGALRVAITGNTFNYAGTQRAILVQGGQDGNGSLDATITGNNIDVQLDGAGNAIAGILAQSAITGPGNTAALCADLGGAGGLRNTFTHSLGGSMAGGDIRVRQRNDGTVRLPGYGGSATDTAAVVTYLSGRNTVVSAPTATADSTGFGGGAACSQPTVP